MRANWLGALDTPTLFFGNVCKILILNPSLQPWRSVAPASRHVGR
jgi:hypothetical protein